MSTTPKINQNAIGDFLFFSYRGDMAGAANLLEQGLVKVNDVDYDNRTALHLAASEGNMEMVKFLVAKGADVNFEDRFGNTPLDDCIRHKHHNVTEILSELGAKVGSKNTDRYQLLDAASKGDLLKITQLITNGIDPNTADYDGRTALHLAVSEGHVAICEYLISKGANPRLVDRWGLSSLDYANRVYRATNNQAIKSLFAKYQDDKQPEPSTIIIDGLTKVFETVKNFGRKRPLTNSSSDQDLPLPLQTKEWGSKKPEADVNVTLESFEILKLIGQGAFGTVHLVSEKSTKQFYAMKEVKKSKAEEFGGVKRLLIELQILRRLPICPYVVQMHYSFETNESIYIIMDYFRRGNLADYMESCPNGRLSESEAAIYAAQILVALEFLHSHGILYRDLKPDNILIGEGNSCCLADFSLSIDLEGKPKLLTNSFVGSPEYVPPEMLNGQRYGKTVDYWSFGVLLFRMLCGTIPFQGKTVRELFQNILREKIDFNNYNWISPEARSLLKGLLKKDINKRITSSKIKTHPFFRKINWKLLTNGSSTAMNKNLN